MLFTALRNTPSIPSQSSNLLEDNADKMKNIQQKEATFKVKPVLEPSFSGIHLQSSLLLSTNPTMVNTGIVNKIVQQRLVPPVVPQRCLGETPFNLLSTMTKSASESNIVQQQKIPPLVPIEKPKPIGRYFL